MRVDSAHIFSTVHFQTAQNALSGLVRTGGPRFRWLTGGLITVVLLASTATFYLNSDSSNSEWLFEGRVFPKSETARMIAALKAVEIPCVEKAGRVSVPASRRAEAFEVLSKGHIGPRPLDELLDDRATAGVFWELPDDRDKRDLRGKEKIAREVIARFRGVVSATVILTPVPSSNRLNSIRTLKATALIETEDDQTLPHSTVDRICHVLTNIDAVDPDAITVLDPSNGRDYRVAGRPDVEARSTVRVREEELREKILEQLRIEGSLVHVRIDPAGSPQIHETEEIHHRSDASHTMGLNHPVVMDSVSIAREEANLPRLMVNTTAGNHMANPEGSGPQLRRTDHHGKAYILVQVPRSYYLKLFQSIHPTQVPTPEDLAPFAIRVRETVHTVVNAIVPNSELAAINILRIDDTESMPPTALTGPTPRKGYPTWFPVVGGIGVAAVVLLILGGGWLAMRRPSFGSNFGASNHRSRSQQSSATSAGPSERVRDLIRLDPSAAAGVLHRWIAQGGHVQ